MKLSAISIVVVTVAVIAAYRTSADAGAADARPTPVPGIAPTAKPWQPDAPSHPFMDASSLQIQERLCAAQPCASAEADRQRPNINRTAVTDRQGQYRFDDVPPGAYMIYASRPGFVQMRAGQKHPLERCQDRGRCRLGLTGSTSFFRAAG